MAGYDLIDEYLAALRPRLGWHPRREDVDSELSDHLYSAADALRAQGVDRVMAQQQVLDRFGRTGEVMAAFASTGSRGMALPTRESREAGRLATLAGGAWILVAGAFSASVIVEQLTGDWNGGPFSLFVVGTSALLGGAVLTVLTLAALQRRHGGLGLVGAVGIGLTALGSAAAFVSWFVYGWGGLIGLGTLLVAASMLWRGIAPRAPTVLLGSAWPVAGATFGLLTWLEVGPRDEWGDYPAAWAAGVSLGAVVFAAGLIGIGRWLTSEPPLPMPTAAPG